MSPSIKSPRPNVIHALTRPVPALPFGALQRAHMDCILELILAAWQNIQANPANNIKNYDEPDITLLLEVELNNFRLSDPIWEAMISSIARGKESVTYDARHIEKKPDLSIYLTSNKLSNFALAVECKIIGGGRTVRNYCDDGLVRFIKGEYAWAWQQGFMLAYVRNSTTIQSVLEPHLKASQSVSPDPYQTKSLPAAVSITGADVARSTHDRTFAYLPPHQASRPGLIDIWHVWLPCT